MAVQTIWKLVHFTIPTIQISYSFQLYSLTYKAPEKLCYHRCPIVLLITLLLKINWAAFI